ARSNDLVTGQCIAYVSPAQIAAIDPQNIGNNSALLSVVNAQYPLANDRTGGDGINTGLFRFNAPVTVDDSTYVSRVDYHMNDRQMLFGRFNIANGKSTQTVQQFPSQPAGQYFTKGDYTWVVGHTWIVNPTMVNKLSVGLAHQDNTFQTKY